MKRIILAVTVLTFAATGMQMAKAGGVHFGLSIGLPLPPIPAPVIVTPAPRVVYQAPVYCPPPPVVVYRAPAYCPPPVCYAPAPGIRFRYGYGERWNHHEHERWEHRHGDRHGRW